MNPQKEQLREMYPKGQPVVPVEVRKAGRARREQQARLVLDVWATYRWSRVTRGECPTLAAVWDPVTTDSLTWVNANTLEQRVSVECPKGPGWELARMWIDRTGSLIHFGIRPSKTWKEVNDLITVATSTRRIENPVRLLALAVEERLCRVLGPFELRLLLLYYPRAGKYEVTVPELSYKPAQRERSRTFRTIECAAIRQILGAKLNVPKGKQ